MKHLFEKTVCMLVACSILVCGTTAMAAEVQSNAGTKEGQIAYIVYDEDGSVLDSGFVPNMNGRESTSWTGISMPANSTAFFSVDRTQTTIIPWSVGAGIFTLRIGTEEESSLTIMLLKDGPVYASWSLSCRANYPYTLRKEVEAGSYILSVSNTTSTAVTLKLVQVSFL